MEQLTWSLTIMILSGIAAWAARGRQTVSASVGAAGCLIACALGLWGAGGCLFLRKMETQTTLWNVPFGSLGLRLDSLAATFLLPVFLVGGMAALAAFRRIPGEYAGNRPGEHWLFYNMTLAGAAGAVMARNAVLFLFAWEVMTVASFLLIENDQREPEARSGGWVYLTAGHLGGACLFAMFGIMSAGGGSNLDFAALGAAGSAATAVFLLALVGFGGKTGLFPFHAWYPESYPSAPPHVGAVLSGVVGNMGIYGLARLVYLLGKGSPPPAWWGYVLLFFGLASAVMGAARSLAGRDLSRLLAWSSVENFGLMSAGLGLGLVGASMGDMAVSFLGFSGAVLHMLNHSVSKALLFLAAGDVYARTGTRSLDRMGGLLKRLPLTGTLFLVGGLGAAAVPPLNGFASEFLLLLGAFTGAVDFSAAPADTGLLLAALACVAVVGGLAAAAYIKAFGFVFLGNPRGPGAVSTAREKRSSLLPHLILALTAVGMAGASPALLALIRPAAEVLARVWIRTGADNAALDAWLSGPGGNPLSSAAIGSWLLAVCLGAALLVRHLLLRGKVKAAGPTWDCGYAAPDGRMQYNASSFARPLAETFQACVNLEDQAVNPRGAFPGKSSFSSSTPGVERAWGYSQLFGLVSRLAARVRVTQAGRVQIYLLYMAAVLVILLAWKL